MTYEELKELKNDTTIVINYPSGRNKITLFNKELLKEEGILEENIVDSGICTYCNSNIIHSYRKEGKEAGRNTALICIK